MNSANYSCGGIINQSTSYHIFDSVTMPKQRSPWPKERARFSHDQFCLIADSVDCEEIHLKEVSLIDIKRMIVIDMKTLNQTV